MRKTLFITFCLMIFGIAASKSQELKSFLGENKKWGYKDASGKEVISPKYDNAQYQFSEGIAAVKKDNLWLYIDKNEKIVLSLPAYISGTPMAFSDDMIFHEGLAPVSVHLLAYDKVYNDVNNPEVRTRLLKELGISAKFNEEDQKKLKEFLTPRTKQAVVDPYRYNYIDKSGKLLLDPFKGYHIARSFSEGLAAVGNYVPGNTYMTMSPQYNYGFIDKTGKLVVGLKYSSVRRFKEGLAAVKHNGLWGFVDSNGKEIVPPQIYTVDDFNNGYAIVAHGKVEPGKQFNAFQEGAVWGIIGKDGKAVVPVAQEKIEIDKNGMVTTLNGKLKETVHISAYEEANKGYAALQTKNFEQAAKHFRLSADKGYSASMGNLGTMYSNGSGVTRNMVEGINWIKKGAEKGDRNSMLNLAMHYAQSQPQNFAEAFKWFKTAVDNNYVPAIGHLALLYATGQGTAQNSTEAKKWLDRGVALGDNHCLFNYGLFHFQGLPGFAKDPKLARSWFNKAEHAGHPQAKEALAELNRMGL